VWAVLRPALAPLITAINWIHRCDNAATRSSKTTTSQPYVTGVDTETRSPRSGTVTLSSSRQLGESIPDIGSPVHSRLFSVSAGMLTQWARESAECVRLSPITHSRPCGTVTGD
jgi:hypothetical protein